VPRRTGPAASRAARGGGGSGVVDLIGLAGSGVVELPEEAHTSELDAVLRVAPAEFVRRNLRCGRVVQPQGKSVFSRTPPSLPIAVGGDGGGGRADPGPWRYGGTQGPLYRVFTKTPRNQLPTPARPSDLEVGQPKQRINLLPVICTNPGLYGGCLPCPEMALMVKGRRRKKKKATYLVLPTYLLFF
jgi:hypothetical protein